MAIKTFSAKVLWEMIKMSMIIVADTHGEGSQRIIFVYESVPSTKAEDTPPDFKSSQIHTFCC